MRTTSFSFLALALAVPALAQMPLVAVEAPIPTSVEAILATALPVSLLAVAVTNPGVVGSIIASEFAAGQTPAWFRALPSDVQTYLVPALATVSASAIISTSATISASATASASRFTSATNPSSMSATACVFANTSRSTSTSTTTVSLKLATSTTSMFLGTGSSSSTISGTGIYGNGTNATGTTTRPSIISAVPTASTSSVGTSGAGELTGCAGMESLSMLAIWVFFAL